MSHRVARLGGQGRFKTFQGDLLVAVNGDQACLGPVKGVGVRRWEGVAGLLVRHPSVDIGDTVFGGRVGHEIVGDLLVVVPLLGAHFFKDVDDALAAVARLVEELEADLVGLDFVLAAVGQHGRLAGRHGADGQGAGRRAGPADAQKNARGDPRQGGQLDLLAAFDLLRDVAADHVGDFVAQNAGQLLFAFHRRDQTAVDEYVARGGGKGVVDILVNDVELVVEGLRWHRCQHLGAYFADIGVCHGIVDDFEMIAHHLEKLPRHLLLFLDGDGEGGRPGRAKGQKDSGQQQADGFEKRVHGAPVAQRDRRCRRARRAVRFSS